MKIEKIKYLYFRITSSFVCSIIVVALTLNGCSPSGLREKKANRQLHDKNTKNKIIRENTHRYLDDDTVGYDNINSNEDPEIKNNNDRSENGSSQKSVKVVSWNLEDFGKSKSDEVINFIANTVKDFDLIAIQEVVAGYGGSQAVARLADELNRKGAKWDYTVSDPTSGESSYKRERYAFLWKTNKLYIVGKPWLEIQFTNEINREPFFATFKLNGKDFTLVNFHAITKKMQPETEIKYFKFLPGEYPDKNLIFCGDFNCPQSHTVFNPLKKMGYEPIFTGQKTSLKLKPVGNEYLASEFDNIFYHNLKVKFISSGVLNFYEYFPTLQDARAVSDHIPIWVQFCLN